MINKVVLIGRLGRDPEMRSLEGGSVVGRFPLATSESYKDKNSGQWIEQTEWHNIVVWRELAQRAGQQLRKGMLVYVEGKITYRSWRESDGRERYTTEIVASVVRMLARPDVGNTPQMQQQPNNNSSTQTPQTTQNHTPPSTSSSNLQQPFYQPPKFNQQPASSGTGNGQKKPPVKKTTPPAVQPQPLQQQPAKQRPTKQQPPSQITPTRRPVDDFPLGSDIEDDYYPPLLKMTPEEEAALRRQIARQQFEATISDLDEALKDEMPLERLSDLLARDDDAPF